MSRTFPRAFFFCFLLVAAFRRPLRFARRSRCASAGAWAPPASSRSVCSLSRRRRLRVARGIDSNIGQVTGLASTASSGLLLPHQNAIAATSHQCGPCAPWSRASASACVRNRRVQGPSNARTKFEATTDAPDAPRARPCSSWASSCARSRRSRRPRPAAARAGRPRRRAR